MPEGVKLPIMADESVMAPKAHGTTETPVQQNLRWNCEWKTADKICSFNRHYAEYAGYWESTNFLEEVDREKERGLVLHDGAAAAADEPPREELHDRDHHQLGELERRGRRR